MAAPFNGEEFYAKRSIFTSLMGLKIGKSSSSKNPVPTPGPPPQPSNYIPNDEPCSSRSFFRQPQPVPEPLEDSYKLSAGDFPGRERSLSEQLADTLLLASPESSREPIQSPHDIYKEIICECAHFEQQPRMQIQEQQLIVQQNMYSPVPQNHQTYYGAYTSPEMPMPYSAPTPSPNVCPHCHHSPVIPKKNTGILEELSGKTSLEDLVKLVVAVVKDTGMLGKNDKKQESPEEILRRKRQQNNEAAARYRRRQKEAKLIANTELDALTVRNNELKKELSYLQDQINKTKAELSQKRVLTTDPSTNS